MARGVYSSSPLFTYTFNAVRRVMPSSLL
jgi:hypothetical protein